MTAIADYKEKVFSTVCLKQRVVDRNMRPKSEVYGMYFLPPANRTMFINKKSSSSNRAKTYAKSRVEAWTSKLLDVQMLEYKHLNLDV